MLNTAKSWLSQEEVSHKSATLKLSIVQLMIGMMVANEDVDEFECAEIKAFLNENFSLTDVESEAMLDRILNDEDHADSFEKDVTELAAAYSIKERAYILSIVWRVALVDGEISSSEEKYLNNLASLFEVPDDTLDALKKDQERDFPNLEQRDRYQEF
ncbi:MAG: TerB family tellurite resistance protein [Mariprofundaceae bacterium]